MKIMAGTGSALAGALALTGALALPGSANATLHGFCAGSAQCVDNGTNSPTSNNPPLNFGFTVSPGPDSGDLLLDILTPDNVSAGPQFVISGTLTGTATLFSATPWTSGQLDAYLGISATPTNGIGAYLPSAQAVDTGATGFFVYQVDLGTTTLQSASDPNVSPLENLTSGVLPLGSYIVAFLNQGADGIQATANSGAIFEDAPPGTTRSFPPVPEPSTWAMLLIGFAGLGYAGYRKTQGSRIAPSIA